MSKVSDAGLSMLASPAPVSANPDITPEFRAAHPTISAVDDFLGNSAAHVARGVAGIAGAPVSAIVNLGNLFRAGYGAAGKATGLLTADQMPEMIDPAAVPGSSANLIQGAENLPGKWGQAFSPPQAETSAGRMGNAALEAIPSAAIGGAGSVLPKVAAAAGYGAAGQAINETVDPNEHPTANALVQAATMFGPGLAKTGAKSYAVAKLKEAIAQSPARSQTQLAAANRELPGGLTVAQTTTSPIIQTLAQQTQGGLAADAAQTQADAMAISLTQKARKLAALPVDAPNVTRSTVQQITDALGQYHDKLVKAGQETYQRGSAQLAAMSRSNPVTVLFPELTKAIGDINAERGDIWTSAPREVQPRLQALFKFLGSDKARGVATMNASEALALGKAINEQWSATERGAVTSKMDEVFGQLKSAYENDLTSNRPDPAIDLLRNINKRYSDAQARVQGLEGSIVNKIVGGFGTSDPDKVIRDMSKMGLEAQRYTRGMLLRYSPDTLRALQGHYIDLHLMDAAPAGRKSFESPTDIHALNPADLAKTGIFDPPTVAELNQAQAAVNTIRNFFPERAAGKVGVNIQAGARLAGSAVEGAHRVSPTFLYGAILHIVSGGKLQRLLLTPEGRNELIQGATSPDAAANLVRNIARYQQATATQTGNEKAKPQPQE
jgi:hypothetical protein